jgi:hypothetical protein
MSKVPLIALRPQTYMTRRLKAGDSFLSRSQAEAKILKGDRRARDDYDAPVKEMLAVQQVAPAAQSSVTADEIHEHHRELPLAEPPAAPAADPLDALRGEARALGVHVDRRWGEARLVQEIDAALERSTKEETPQAPAAEPNEAVAMTTDSASALMPQSWRHDEE